VNRDSDCPRFLVIPNHREVGQGHYETRPHRCGAGKDSAVKLRPTRPPDTAVSARRAHSMHQTRPGTRIMNSIGRQLHQSDIKAIDESNPHTAWGGASAGIVCRGQECGRCRSDVIASIFRSHSRRTSLSVSGAAGHQAFNDMTRSCDQRMGAPHLDFWPWYFARHVIAGQRTIS